MVEEDKLIYLSYREENYNDLIDKIVNIYDSITGVDMNKIKNSVTQLAKAGLSYSEQKIPIYYFPKVLLHQEVKMI
ncbi:hypothetical protein [Arsenophonus endosymbiont of Bemisia tabaci]|uniref:hypothetical protein n=1 Tax=Arsenophonus endosymbiont of Bemisia tabaci TaxID=536059 RepID=UPI0015F6437E|nr:hypothetical protein [Arsenophonus endosymbiont of Bemisia tabaci]